MLQKFKLFWAREKSLFILLVILSIHLFIILPLGDQSGAGRILGFVFYVFLLFAGLLVLTRFKTRRLAFVILTICLLVLSTNIFLDDRWVMIITNVCIISYFGLLTWIVLLKTFSDGPITIYRIEGSIVVYLLIGLIFANLYNIMFLLEGEKAFRGLINPDIKQFLYFSFTTLTTAGYGDITPALPVTRSMANLESLIGQLYPAILIARLVSMEISDRQLKG